MNARDKELVKQAWTENDWDGHVDIPKLIQLVRADAMEAANRAATASWTLMCKKMVEFEREACALICDEHADDPVYCGAAIRTRGNT
jgi:hypothetical protein